MTIGATPSTFRSSSDKLASKAVRGMDIDHRQGVERRAGPDPSPATPHRAGSTLTKTSPILQFTGKHGPFYYRERKYSFYRVRTHRRRPVIRIRE